MKMIQRLILSNILCINSLAFASSSITEGLKSISNRSEHQSIAIENELKRLYQSFNEEVGKLVEDNWEELLAIRDIGVSVTSDDDVQQFCFAASRASGYGASLETAEPQDIIPSFNFELLLRLAQKAQKASQFVEEAKKTAKVEMSKIQSKQKKIPELLFIKAFRDILIREGLIPNPKSN